MTYSAPTITNSGLTIPQYSDILNYYISQAQAIFGSTIYLGNDSLDYQLLATIALVASDTMNGLQLSYNSFGAQTVTGSAEDALFRLNGIARKSATYSTCNTVVITGTAATVINNGICQDQSGNLWSLPTSITIGGGGTVTVTATCQTAGAINAAAGTITIINTPTYGWTSVTNSGPAVAGNPIETDAQFRARQTQSTAIASVSPLNGVEAAIAQVSGVDRYVVYENPTGSSGSDPNGYGLPAHSITAVVEGGTSANIANAIWTKKAPGVLSNGSTTVNIIDQYNNTTPISFYILAYTTIYVVVNIHQLPTYVSTMTAQIQTAVSNYLNNLSIGETVLDYAIAATVMNVNANLAAPAFTVRSVYIGTSPSPNTSTDITIAYNYASTCTTSNVTVNSVA